MPQNARDIRQITRFIKRQRTKRWLNVTILSVHYGSRYFHNSYKLSTAEWNKRFVLFSPLYLSKVHLYSPWVVKSRSKAWSSRRQPCCVLLSAAVSSTGLRLGCLLSLYNIINKQQIIIRNKAYVCFLDSKKYYKKEHKSCVILLFDCSFFLSQRPSPCFKDLLLPCDVSYKNSYCRCWCRRVDVFDCVAMLLSTHPQGKGNRSAVSILCL